MLSLFGGTQTTVLLLLFYLANSLTSEYGSFALRLHHTLAPRGQMLYVWDSLVGLPTGTGRNKDD